MRRLVVIVLCLGFTASTDPFLFCTITQDPPIAFRVVELRRTSVAIRF